MSLDIHAGAKRAGAPYPLQFVNIEIMPLDRRQDIPWRMQATLLDEEELEFVGQDLAHERVETLDQALAIIRAERRVACRLRQPHEAAMARSSSHAQQTAFACSTTTSAATFVGGQVVMTQGVNELPLDTKARVLLAVQSFDEFTADNDPHREHDFGSFEIDGETYFFKIDYYALDMDGGSEDPADPGEDDARAHHHARRRILTPQPTERRPAMAAISNRPIAPIPSSSAKAKMISGSPSARRSCTRTATATTSSCRRCRSTARSCFGCRRTTGRPRTAAGPNLRTINPALDAGSS